MPSTFIIIGAPGMGKSPFIRTMIQARRCLIFDIQNEYGNDTKYPGQTPVGLPSDTTKERARYTGNDVDEFIKVARTRKKAIIIFEEATAFFGGKTEKNLRRYLIDRYHSKNTSAFVFHSIQSVPPFIFTVCDYVVLFKTLDVRENVLKKNPRIVAAFDKLQVLPNGEKIIVKLI